MLCFWRFKAYALSLFFIHQKQSKTKQNKNKKRIKESLPPFLSQSYQLYLFLSSLCLFSTFIFSFFLSSSITLPNSFSVYFSIYFSFSFCLFSIYYRFHSLFLSLSPSVSTSLFFFFFICLSLILPLSEKNQSPTGIKWSAVPLPCFLGFHGGKQGSGPDSGQSA